MKIYARLVCSLILFTPCSFAETPDHPGHHNPFPGFAENDIPARQRLAEQINELTSADQLRSWHDLLASEPHIAGTPGDIRNIARMANAFEVMGLEVDVHEFFAYLPRPGRASLSITTPEHINLPLREIALDEDPDSANPDLTDGWNGYSGSGTAEANIVYANYGRLQDFQKLAEMNIDLHGKIVLARYGGNYRGYKAKFAEEAGAAGLIIFVDPSDSGYAKGLLYPEGGWANNSQIQRGSIKTLPYAGDPLTPFIEATENADRLDPDSIALPHIPVQPIGYGAALQILARMNGDYVPKGWQGGLPVPYRITGGDELVVRLEVHQPRQITRSANVIATIQGSIEPEKLIIIGAHHDAWNFGASDPLSGTICVMEAARVCSELYKNGWRPRRSIVFATWGAEEMGIIGSTEWVEANRDNLLENAVTYINLDMASMGPNFNASASPSIRAAVASIAKLVPQARNHDLSVFDAWLGRGEDPVMPAQPSFGDLGGGSDHISFNCHLSVACVGMGGSGSSGTSYHSNYDTLAWYRKVVGDDYEPALMVARMATQLAVHAADAPLIALDPARSGLQMKPMLTDLTKRAIAKGVLDKQDAPIHSKFAELSDIAATFAAVAGQVRRKADAAAAAGDLDDQTLQYVNDRFLAMDRVWLSAGSVPERPWFRNLFAATDESSGYASWMLPGLRYAIEHEDAQELDAAIERCIQIFQTLTLFGMKLDEKLARLEPDVLTLPDSAP